MSERQTHTAAPWNHHKAPASGGGTVHVIQAGKSHGITVCTIRAGIDKGNSDRIDEICEANAQLIASAPELLFALRYILEQTHLGHIHDTASAAIAKAKGEA